MGKITFSKIDDKPDKPCWACHGKTFWNRGWGWTCNNCHPCLPDVKVEWIEVE